MFYIVEKHFCTQLSVTLDYKNVRSAFSALITVQIPLETGDLKHFRLIFIALLYIILIYIITVIFVCENNNYFLPTFILNRISELLPYNNNNNNKVMLSALICSTYFVHSDTK